MSKKEVVISFVYINEASFCARMWKYEITTLFSYPQQCLKKSRLNLRNIKKDFNIAIMSKNTLRKVRSPQRSGAGSDEPWWGWGDGWGGGLAGGWGDNNNNNNNNNNPNTQNNNWDVSQGGFPNNFPTNYYPWYVYQLLMNNLDNAASAIPLLPTSATRIATIRPPSPTKADSMAFPPFVSTTPLPPLISLPTAVFTTIGNTPSTLPTLPTTRPPILMTSKMFWYLFVKLLITASTFWCYGEQKTRKNVNLIKSY